MGEAGDGVEIGSLVAGEHLHSADGRSVEVKSVRHFEQQAPVYDLTVDEVHDYFVGAGVAAVLVHNCAAPNVRASPAASDWATKGGSPNLPEPRGWGRIRADQIEYRYVEHMNTHNWGNSKNRAPEMRRLITALGRIK